MQVQAGTWHLAKRKTTNPNGTVCPKDFVTFTKGRYKILITYNKDLRDLTYFKKDKISEIYPSNDVDSNGIPYTITDIGQALGIQASGRKTIYSIGFWNRALTDEEITKLMEA